MNKIDGERGLVGNRKEDIKSQRPVGLVQGIYDEWQQEQAAPPLFDQGKQISFKLPGIHNF